MNVNSLEARIGALDRCVMELEEDKRLLKRKLEDSLNSISMNK